MCVLALVAEHPAHGWAISRKLEPDDEIGRIWTADRQRVYRAIRTLERRALIESVGLEPGGGPHRIIYRATDRGRAELDRWLHEPTDRMRDVQSTFLLKLAFVRRSNIDPEPLIAAQHEIVAAAVADLEAQLADEEDAAHLRLKVRTLEVLLEFLEEHGASPVARDPARAARPTAVSRGGRHRGDAPSGSTSALSGRPIGQPDDEVTIIMRYTDTNRGIVVARAHVDDEVVDAIDRAGRRAT